MSDLRGPGALVPPAAERYLHRVVEPEATSLLSATLRLRGRRRVAGRWVRFASTMTLAPLQGFLEDVSLHLGPITFPYRRRRFPGRDAPADGADRLGVASLWLPSALHDDTVVWTELPDGRIAARWTLADGAPIGFTLSVDRAGLPTAVRAGALEGRVEATGRFHGVTIPTRLRVGDHLELEVEDLEPAAVRMSRSRA